MLVPSQDGIMDKIYKLGNSLYIRTLTKSKTTKEHIMNKVILQGNLTKDAAAVETSNGKLAVFITFAINSVSKNNNAYTDYIDCTVFMDKGTDISKLVKGASMKAEGSLNNRKTVDRGENRYVLGVVVTRLEHI